LIGLNGFIYIIGSTEGDIDGEININNDDSFDWKEDAFKEDAFISKFSADGEKQWTRLIGSIEDDDVWAITAGLDGSIYIAGETQGNLDGQTNSGDDDAFISKFSTDGEKQWTKLFGSIEGDGAAWLTSGLDGSISIISGSWEAIAGPNNDEMKIYMSKFFDNGNSLNENIEAGSVIANLSTNDANIEDTHTYELIKGEGDTDNDSFTIDGDKLKIISSPDYETQSSYNIRLKTTDSSGLSYEEAVTLSVNDINEKSQKISGKSNQKEYIPGQIVNIQLLYDTTDNTSNLSGLGLKVHYDSSLINPKGENSGVNASVTTFGNPKISDDLDDLDNDSSTDKFIDIVWADFNANFPGSELPTELATLTFESSKEILDTVTGESKINFTSSNPAENYDFIGESITLKPLVFTLDVDGNENVSALGDGLMIIRKLFGSAFDGDALTNKAISDNATRTTDEIHEYIQSGIDSLALDVDKNGKVTALGDGLMIIRHLFGSAFAGDALIDKAISSESPYYGEDDASQMVADNIDSLLVL